PICELSDETYARILFSLARTSKASIIIFNKILQNLTDEYFEKAIELSDEYINNNLTVVMIDDNVERVSKASNYIAWVSHGQLRMEGSINQVIPVFNEHEKDRASLESKEEKQNFDLDWKKSRARTPELTYNFKRIERYNHVKPPIVLVRFWTFITICILGMVLTAVLMFNDIGKIEIGQNEDQASIQNQPKNPYEDKLSYGIVLDDSVKLDNFKNGKDLSPSKYALPTITGENTKNYRVSVDNQSYKVGKKDIRYFVPAGLFEEHSGDTLAPFMSKNYSNYYEFFNSHLHKKHGTVTDSLVPEETNNDRSTVPIVQQTIAIILNAQNKLSRFTIPMKYKAKLKDKHTIDSNFWTTKSAHGYFMADFKNDKWIYIEL